MTAPTRPDVKHDHRALLAMSGGRAVNEWAGLAPGRCSFVPFDTIGRMPDEVRAALCGLPATVRWEQTLLDVDGHGAEMEQFALLCAGHAPVVDGCPTCNGPGCRTLLVGLE